jgi:hypothetical protein
VESGEWEWRVREEIGGIERGGEGSYLFDSPPSLPLL